MGRMARLFCAFGACLADNGKKTTMHLLSEATDMSVTGDMNELRAIVDQFLHRERQIRAMFDIPVGQETLATLKLIAIELAVLRDQVNGNGMR